MNGMPINTVKDILSNSFIIGHRPSQPEVLEGDMMGDITGNSFQTENITVVEDDVKEIVGNINIKKKEGCGNRWCTWRYCQVGWRT